MSKLEPTPADIRHIIPEQAQGRIGRDGKPGFGLLLPIAQHATREQNGLRPLPRRGAAALDQQFVQASLYWQSEAGLSGVNEMVGAPEPGPSLVFTIVFAVTLVPAILLCPAY